MDAIIEIIINEIKTADEKRKEVIESLHGFKAEYEEWKKKEYNELSYRDGLKEDIEKCYKDLHNLNIKIFAWETILIKAGIWEKHRYV